VKEGWNGIEKEADGPWGGWFLGRWLMCREGLWASQEPFYVRFN